MRQSRHATTVIRMLGLVGLQSLTSTPTNLLLCILTHQLILVLITAKRYLQYEINRQRIGSCILSDTIREWLQM